MATATIGISHKPDSRFESWHLRVVDTNTLCDYLREAEHGAFTAYSTDKAAWHRAWEHATDELLLRRRNRIK